VPVLLALCSLPGHHALAQQLPVIDNSASSIGGDFTLTDHHGHEFTLASLRGSVVVLLFGYTSCPDICPTELNVVSSLLKQYKQPVVKAVFVTVDPARDTVDKLANYVSFFHPAITGLTGSNREIADVASQYHVRFSRHGEPDNYSIDHSSGIFIIDSANTVRAIAPFGATADHLSRIIDPLIQARINN